MAKRTTAGSGRYPGPKRAGVGRGLTIRFVLLAALAAVFAGYLVSRLTNPSAAPLAVPAAGAPGYWAEPAILGAGGPAEVILHAQAVGVGADDGFSFALAYRLADPPQLGSWLTRQCVVVAVRGGVGENTCEIAPGRYLITSFAASSGHDETGAPVPLRCQGVPSTLTLASGAQQVLDISCRPT